ncbi:DUF190 domain-containing protein [Nitrosomonas sp. Nm166]|uniref:DUF190 domain-containing protein n=1 Tax=Nitrosomonas sp. Nm166 TaxID=1881054 RepID=UPI00210BCA5A|nr:DUF190 domain-containing protein [Nitrosomonas sp. Nm166]
MKRFEIVTGIEQLEQLIELLERSGVSGYTVIKNTGGYGSRGVRNPDDVLMADENVSVILACHADEAQKLLAELRPAKKDLGGICLVSDCHWIDGLTAS